LQDAASRGTEAVFATKNSKDFGQPAVRRRLREVGCELVFSFADAVARSAGRS
jgi:hypothetical protein